VGIFRQQSYSGEQLHGIDTSNGLVVSFMLAMSQRAETPSSASFEIHHKNPGNKSLDPPLTQVTIYYSLLCCFNDAKLAVRI
jgi:hypothetical protein